MPFCQTYIKNSFTFIEHNFVLQNLSNFYPNEKKNTKTHRQQPFMPHVFIIFIQNVYGGIEYNSRYKVQFSDSIKMAKQNKKREKNMKKPNLDKSKKK